MAVTHGRSAKVYGGGYDLSGILRKVDFSFKHDTHDSTVLGKSHRTKIYGFEDAEAKLEGFVDAAHAAGFELDDAIGRTKTVLVHLPDGDSLSARGQGFDGLGKDVEYGSEDAPNKLSGLIESKTGAEEIVVAMPVTNITATTNGSAVNFGAATTVECVGYVMVMAYTGLTSIALKWQHSTTSGGPWVDITGGAHTVVTAARQHERIVIPVGTSVDAYVRLVATVVGAGNADIFGAFGRRNQ